MIALPDLMTILALAGSTSEVAGYSLKDLFTRKSKPSVPSKQDVSPVDHTKLLREVLAACDDPHDPITGYWELFNWPVPDRSESMKGRRVEKGHLIIFYRSRSELTWHGVMTYVLSVSNSNDEGPYSEPPFIAIYDVAFQEANDAIEGNLVLRDKEYLNSTPDLEEDAKAQKESHHMGQFYGCKVEGKGAAAKFEGQYQTMRRTGEIHFLFRARKRWAELQNVPNN